MARHDEDSETESPAKKGGSNIMIIAGVIVLSAGIIGGGLFFGLKGHAPAAAVAEGGGEKKDEKSDHAKGKEAPFMYPLEAFIVNISDGQDFRYLKLKVELETPLGAEVAKKEMDPYLAPLRDSILVLLTTKTIKDVQDVPGKSKLKAEILAAAKKIMPAGKISNVYFTDFVVQ